MTIFFLESSGLTGCHSDEQSSIKLQLKKIRREASELNAVTADKLDTIRSDILKAIANLPEQEDGEFEPEAQTESLSSAPNNVVEHKGIIEVQKLLGELMILARGIPIQHTILKELNFEYMHLREDTIQDAEVGTFEWMLHGANDQQNTDFNDHNMAADAAVRAELEEQVDVASDSDLIVYGSSDITIRDTSETVPNVETSRNNGGFTTDQGYGQNKESDSVERCESPSSAFLSSVKLRNPLYSPFHSPPSSPLPTGYWMSNLLTSGSDRNIPLLEREDGPIDYGSELEDEISDGDSTCSRQESSQELLPTWSPTPSIFVSWLRSGAHIFHILGKAGAGKSTLMKFLSGHPRTKEELNQWTGNKKLVMAHFYFWSSGKNELQMSLDGLYRSILFEVLCQCPNLIQEVFPEKWEDVVHSISGHLSSTAVKRAFENLVSRTSSPTHRFCFFIDGLDEYSGDSTAHWELARLLQTWSRGADIKICSSSRPHTEFLVTFNDPLNTVIHLHELTRDDIYQFTCQMLTRDPAVGELTRKYEDLAWMIVDKAEGVFLWARLTVRLLLDSIGRRDRPEILMQRLQGVPEGLDDLYEKLLGTVLSADRRRSDLMLLITIRNPFPFPLNAMTYAWLDDLDDPSFPLNKHLKPFSKSDIDSTHDYVQRQLHSLTKGMLELTAYRNDEYEHFDRGPFFSRSVQFFHRTAKDYLQSSKIDQMSQRSDHIDFMDSIARLRLAEYKWGMDSGPLGLSDWPHAFLVETFHHIKCDLAISLVGGFKTKLEQLITTPRARISIPVFFATYGSADGVIIYDFHQLGSWPHFIAAYSQTKYVMHLVEQQPDLLQAQNHDLSLLLSAITGGNCELVTKLLEKGASVHDHVLMRDDTSRRMLMPVWLLALANSIGDLVKAVAFYESETECTRLIEDLIQHGADDSIVLIIDENKLCHWESSNETPYVFRPGNKDDDSDSSSETDPELQNDGLMQAEQTVEFSGTVRRFLDLCEARMREIVWDDAKQEGSQQRCLETSAWIEESLMAKNIPGDISNSRIFNTGDFISREEYSRLYMSIRWKGEQFGLPLNYRVY